MLNIINKAPLGLYKKVVDRIENEKSIIAIRRRLIVSSFVFVASFSCFVLSIIFFLSAASANGFSQVFSLIFSDFSFVTSYSISFVLSLLEILPISNMIVSLLMIILVSFVANFLTKDIKNLMFYSHIKY